MIVYIVYFIIITVLAVEYEFSHFKRWPMLVMLICMLGVLAGLQGPDVSKDSNNYQYIFYSVDTYLNQMKSGSIITSIEPGCLLIIVVLRKIFELNYVVAILVFFAFTSIILKTYIVNKFSINPFLVLLFYYSHYFLLCEMTQIRMGLATAVFFVAVKYLLEGNKRMYIFLIFLAMCFHYSAFMYFGVLFLNFKRINRYVAAGVLMLSIFFGVMQFPLFDLINPDWDLGKINGYHSTAKYMLEHRINPFNVVTIANMVCIAYYVFLVPRDILLKDNKMILFIKCNMLSVFLLDLISGVPTLVFRFSELFGLLSIFLFGGLITYLPFGRLNIFFLVLLAGLFFYIHIYHVQLLKPYYLTNIK